MKLSKLGRRISAGNFQQVRTSTEWVWLDSPRVEEPKEAPKAGNSDEETADILAEMHGEELEAWQVLSKAAGDSRVLPTTVIFLSMPTAELAKKEKD